MTGNSAQIGARVAHHNSQTSVGLDRLDLRLSAHNRRSAIAHSRHLMADQNNILDGPARLSLSYLRISGAGVWENAAVKSAWHQHAYCKLLIIWTLLTNKQRAMRQSRMPTGA